MRASLGLKQENKMYKLKRSIHLFNYRLIMDPHNVQLPVGLIAPLVE